MKERLISPKTNRDSDQLFRLIGRKAIDDAFPIVPLDKLNPRGVTTPYNVLIKIWTEKGFGREIKAEDGYSSSLLWSFSDAGLAEAQKLSARQRRGSMLARLRRHMLPLLGLMASVAAAIAAALSAYFSYLGLPTK